MFKFLFGFLPWILYAVIANHGFVSDEIAAGLALASVFILDFKRIKKGYILECGTVLFFAALLILFLLPSRHYVALHAMLWINIALALIMWFSILIRRPFTIQYAKESVPKSAWNKPGFIRVNDILSGFWALVVTIGAFTPEWANIVGIIIAVKFTQQFPDWYAIRQTAKNPFLQGNFAPIHTEIDVHDLAIEGQLPLNLQGVYMRNGPNPAFPPITYTYPIDGDGMIHAVYIENGKVHYRNRFVHTPKYLAEQKAGKAIYKGLARGESPNGAFIHIIRHAQQYLAMHEGDIAYQINAELSTLGEWKPTNATPPFAVNAHTRLDPDTGELFTITYDSNPPYLRYAILNAQGEVTCQKSIEKTHPTMIHDFVLTQHYLVIVDCPAVLDTVNLGLAWKPELGTTIILIDRKTHAMKTFKTDAFFIFHFANGFEQENQIILDYVRHECLKLGSEIKELNLPPKLYRTVLNLQTAAIEHIQLDDHSLEFPRINETFISKPYRFIYAPTKTTGLMKYDLQERKPTFHDFGPNTEIGEAVFIAKGPEEDNGYVALFVYYAETKCSEWVLLDAQRFSEKPLARVKMPQRVPHGLHGSWFPQQ